MATIEVTLKRAMFFLTAIAAFAAVGGAFGWKFIGPADAFKQIATTDSMLAGRIAVVETQVEEHTRDQQRFRDTVMTALRPLNISLCLDRSPRELALMDLDCDSILGAARNAAIMESNGRTMKARP